MDESGGWPQRALLEIAMPKQQVAESVQKAQGQPAHWRSAQPLQGPPQCLRVTQQSKFIKSRKGTGE
jgi:hypothetical protein